MRVSTIIEKRLYQCSYPSCGGYNVLKNEFNVDIIVDLTELPHFTGPYEIHQIDENLTKIRYPIFDYCTPPSFSSFKKLIKYLEIQYNEGKIIAIHCMGGRGRSSIVSCCLYSKLFNKDFHTSLKYVRNCMQCNVPETIKQEDFIRSFINYYYNPEKIFETTNETTNEITNETTNGL